MFPIPFNFPFRKKNGDITTIGDAINSGGGGDPYVLPVASADTLGGIKVGSGLSILNGVLSATGGSGSSCHLYSGGCGNGWLKNFYILSSVDTENPNNVPISEFRGILYGGVGYVAPHADSQYNSAGRIPTFFTIASATANKITVLTDDMTIDNGSIKIAKNIQEPEYSYLSSGFSMKKIF